MTVPKVVKVLAAGWGVVVLVAACSSESPAVATLGNEDGGGQGGRGGAACATPQEDCPCDDAEAIVDCGKTVQQVGSFAICSLGKRACDGTRWGACNGENGVTTKNVASLHPAGLGSSSNCAGIDDCDPYCQAFVDTPSGLVVPGFGTSDAGIFVSNGDASAAIPTSVLTSSNGTQGCGTTPVTATTCVTGGVVDWSRCQQDFRCDVASNRCAWNGGTGYRDTTAGVADLQIGSACTYGGTGVIPVCNRGSVATPATGTIGINLLAAVPADSCAAIGPADCSAPVPTGGLAPGQCMNVTGCPFTAATVAAVVNAGNRDVNEGTTRCKNNAATAKDPNLAGCAACGSCDTRLTGTAYAPNGTTPLAGVSVFEPGGPMTPFVDGVACDTCASLSTPPASGATSAANGTFTIYGAVPGPNRIVTQSGRWRRTVDVNVPACASTPLPAAQTRLPRTRFEGDIPKTALVQGDREALECTMTKFGIAPAEIDRRGAGGNQHRIQLYRPGAANLAMSTYSGGASPPAADLWGATGSLDEYAAMVVTCSAAMKDFSTVGPLPLGDIGRFTSWVNRGGRAFLDHWGGDGFIHQNTALAGTSTWADGNTAYGTMRGRVNATTPAQILMRDWLFTVGASSDWGLGWMRSDLPWRHALNPTPANTTEWLRGLSTYSPMNGTQWTTTPAGNLSLSYSFETPLAAAAGTCPVNGGGRVIYNGMHVAPGELAGSAHPSSAFSFPGDCQPTGLTSEELALMYQFFQLTACALGGAPPPPVPPPPPPLPTGVVFVRDYEAVCAMGSKPVWQPFQWQAQVPAGTSISFKAATAANLADLPEPPAGAPPATAAIGTANATTTVWTSDPDTVDKNLEDDTGQASKKFLRVFMTFNTTAVQSPILSNWRQLYDCIPVE